MASKRVKKRNCASDNYSVVQFIERGNKLFECIWDGWFVDENRDSCFWPPKRKSYLLRVLSKEKPDDSWKKCECVVISEGHVTYNSGFDYVKEKCAQKFNTSSADEQQEALRYRRKHPVLASTKAESFEHVFKKDDVNTKHKLKGKTGRKKPGASQQNDVNGADKKLSNDYDSASSPRLLDSSQRSRPRSVSLSSSGSRISQKCLSNTEATHTSFVSPGSNCSSKITTSPFSNRSSSKRSSRSRSSARQQRSNSRCRAFRSNSSRRSRSNSRSRSLSRSCFRVSRSRSNSSRRSRSNSRSRSRSRSSFNTSQRTKHSRSKSSSVRRSTSPTSVNQLGTKKVLPPSSGLHFMQLQLTELRTLAKQNHYRITVNDRRLSRMEVTMNKVLVTITDLKHAIISKNTSTGDAPMAQSNSNQIPKGFKNPDLPIETLPQLLKLNRNLGDGEFRLFLLTQEKYYCSASRQSDTAIMTAYLKRFISLALRDTLHLKDAKGKDEPTLIHHFPQIYKFLIDVMITGYKESKTQLKTLDAHVALRTVWGRTKQMLREQKS